MKLEEVLDDLGIPYLQEGGHHHARPGWIQIDCPFCGPGSHRFHMGYHLTLRYCNCWRCGSHHLVKVLEALGLARDKAWEVHRSVDTDFAIKRERTRISLKIPAGIGPLGPSHVRYLRGRGFDPEEISKTWKVQGIGLSPRLAWRIYIPVIHQGAQVSWTTRAIGDRVTQRYISASAEEEAINHKSVVYGADFCHHSIVVVEGPIDAWAVGPGAGALFGTGFSIAQVRKIAQFPRRIICLDSSPDAQERARELADQLSVFPGVTENVVLDGKDPAEAPKNEIRLLRKIANL